MADQKVDIETLMRSEESDEINVKGLFEVLDRYKKSIIFITLLFTLIASIQAYLAVDVYQSQALIKIPAEKYKGSLDDFMTLALGQEGTNIEDELIVLETHNIATKALGSLNIGTRYYAKSNLKQIELYKDSPFLVIENDPNPKAYSLTFKLEPIDERSFRLSIEQPLNQKIKDYLLDILPFVKPDDTGISYNKIHEFDTKIEAPWFAFTVQKIKEFRYKDYSFTITPNASMGGFIGSRLTASGYIKKGNIISLTFVDSVPLRAMEVLDAVTKSYLEETENIKMEGSKKKLFSIDLQLETVSGMLENSAKMLQAYKMNNTITNLDVETSTTILKLSEIERDRYNIKVRYETLKEALGYIESNKEISGIGIDGGESGGNTYQYLVNAIQEAAAEHKASAINNKSNHPKVLMSKVKLDSLKKSLHDMIIASLANLEKREAALDSVIASYQKSLQGIPKKEQKLEHLKRNFMINENIYTYLLKKKAETVISESSEVSGTRAVENASLPSSSNNPDRKMMIMKGLLMGLVLGLMSAFVRNLLDIRVKNIYTIEKLTKLSIYGMIPSKSDMHTYNESMRTLWTNLEFSCKKDTARLITFTSSVSGEGKSTIVAHLGDIIAQSNKRVVIVDFDMRQATLHEIFQLSNKAGTSTLLSQINNIDEVLQDTHNEKLKVITSGPKPPNPTALIMSDYVQVFLNELKRRFDYILLDSSPVGLVSDAKKLMHLSDVTLIVVRIEYTTKEQLKQIDRSVKSLQNNVGLVVNDIKTKNSNKYSAYYQDGYQ